MKAVKFVLMLPVYFIGVLAIYFIFTVLNKAYWDARVKSLCLESGGITVFETAVISQVEYQKYGGERGVMATPIEGTPSALDSEFVSRITSIELNDYNPMVIKFVGEVYRKSDNFVLGRYVSFSRSGGDFPSLGHESSFSCADMDGNSPDLVRQIFFVEGER